MSTDTRSHAAGVLGLAPDASSGEAAGAFLRALPGAEFVPSAEAVAALNELAGTSVPADPDGEPGLSFRGQVEGFARRFWSLPPVERLAAWVSLGERAGDDAAAARLLALQPGLEVPADALPDPLAESVASLVRALFVLPPRERAIRRNEWLLANATRHADLSRAAAELSRLRPDLAALEPLLLAKLEPWFKAATFAEAASETPRNPTHHALEAFTKQFEAATTAAEKQERRDTNNRLWIVWGVLVLLAVLVWDGRREPAQRPPSSYPNIKMPKVTMPEFKPVVLDPPPHIGGFGRVSPFTSEQITAFEAYDAHQHGIPPAWYVEWVRAGRPKAGQPVILPPRRPGVGKER